MATLSLNPPLYCEGGGGGVPCHPTLSDWSPVAEYHKLGDLCIADTYSSELLTLEKSKTKHFSERATLMT